MCCQVCLAAMVNVIIPATKLVSGRKAIPLQAWTGPGGSKRLRLPDFNKSAHEGGKVVSPMYRPPLPPGNIPIRGCVDPTAIVRPEGLCQWKMPMTPSAIEPATFRVVAQCLNQQRHRVPCRYWRQWRYAPFVLNLSAGCPSTVC